MCELCSLVQDGKQPVCQRRPSTILIGTLMCCTRSRLLRPRTSAVNSGTCFLSSPRDCRGATSLRSPNWRNRPRRDVPVGCMRTAKHRQSGEGASMAGRATARWPLSNGSGIDRRGDAPALDGAFRGWEATRSVTVIPGGTGSRDEQGRRRAQQFRSGPILRMSTSQDRECASIDGRDPEGIRLSGRIPGRHAARRVVLPTEVIP